MPWLLAISLLLVLPSSATEDKWINMTVSQQCKLIALEINRAVDYGTITSKEAKVFIIRCHKRTPKPF